jgi:hypothetical protein
MTCSLAKGICYDLIYCDQLLSAQTDHTIQSLLYFKNNYQTQQKHKNFSTEFFHLILNKYLGCALINEHNLVIVKTNQNKN